MFAVLRLTDNSNLRHLVENARDFHAAAEIGHLGFEPQRRQPLRHRFHVAADTERPARALQEDGANLLQINVRGRILQIEFETTPDLVSTEDFRIPYTLSGAVRAFNQALLDKDLIEEQLIFYTLEKKTMWRFFDARTYRSGEFDQAYLVGLMEQLL